MRAKVSWIVRLLEEFGPHWIRQPYIKPLDDKLWEMQMKGRVRVGLSQADGNDSIRRGTDRERQAKALDQDAGAIGEGDGLDDRIFARSCSDIGSLNRMRQGANSCGTAWTRPPFGRSGR